MGIYYSHNVTRVVINNGVWINHYEKINKFCNSLVMSYISDGEFHNYKIINVNKSKFDKYSKYQFRICHKGVNGEKTCSKDELLKELNNNNTNGELSFMIDYLNLN